MIATTVSVTTTAHSASAVTAAPGCTVGAPLVPLISHPVISTERPYASLTATNNRGTWAGVRYAGNSNIQVISWRAGHTTVLDTISYGSGPWDGIYSIKVVGVAADGSVVAAVQDPVVPTDGDTIGLRYQNGHRYVLAHRPGWTDYVPTSVAPDGRVAGEVGSRGSQAVVEWSAVGSGQATVISAVGSGRTVNRPAFDQYGDFIWQADSTVGSPSSMIRALTTTGRLISLNGATELSPELSAVAGRYAWAGVGASEPNAVWDLAAAAGLPSGSVLQPVRFFTLDRSASVYAGAPSGAFLTQFIDVSGAIAYRYFDAWGDEHVLPAAFHETYESVDRVFGLATDGTIALTTPDGNVRFVTCALSSVGHEPGGRVYTATSSGNSVTITGGGLDPDLPSAPIDIDLYDQSAGKTLVGRYLADQTNTSAAAVWYKLQHHSFSATFTASPGTHTYCLYGINIRYGNINPQLACTTVTVT